MVYVCRGREANERQDVWSNERQDTDWMWNEKSTGASARTNERRASVAALPPISLLQTSRRLAVIKLHFQIHFVLMRRLAVSAPRIFESSTLNTSNKREWWMKIHASFFSFCFGFLLWPMGSPLLNVGVRYFLCLFLLFDWQFSTIEKRRHDVTTIQRKLQSRFFVTWMSVIVSLCFCTFLLVVVDSLLPAVPDGLLRPDCPQINTRSYSTFLDFSNKFLFSLLAIEDHRHPIRCCWNSDKTNSKGRKKVTIAVEYGSQFGRDWWRWKIHLIAVSLQYLLQSNPNSVTDDFDHQLDCKDGQWINRWRMEVTKNIPFMAPVMAMDR